MDVSFAILPPFTQLASTKGDCQPLYLVSYDETDRNMQWFSQETSANLNGNMNETRSWAPADGKSAPAISCDADQVFKAMEAAPVSP